jgi:hypothetical protein
MQAVIFEVLTKAVLLMVGIGAFIVWANAGFPLWTITRR